jgi:hypothetical protein
MDRPMTGSDAAAAKIVEDKEQSRYEAHLGEETVAIADYVKQPGIVSFTHTETFDATKARAWRVG